MSQYKNKEKLIMLPLDEYIGVNRDDPIRQYHKPIFGDLYRKRVEMCLQKCTGGDRVLEIGFGSGVTFINLAQKYHQIFGVDLTSDAQAIQKMFLDKGIATQLDHGSLLELPYNDEQFDTVLMISILEHIHPEQLTIGIKEVQRVLKRGGQMVYGVPVSNPVTRLGFYMLGYDIRKHHFATEMDVKEASKYFLTQTDLEVLRLPVVGVKVYEVGTFTK